MKRTRLKAKPLVKQGVLGGENGASEEIRTLDINLGKVTLYQLSYARIYCRYRYGIFENVQQ